jgi:hypothetical protein
MLSLLERGLRSSVDLEAKLDAFLTSQERLTPPATLSVKRAGSVTP